MDISPLRKRSKSITSLHSDIDALSSALERFHYKNESSSHVHLPRSGTSSVEVSISYDTDSMDTSEETRNTPLMEDSGICDKTACDGDLIVSLEKKIDMLIELVQQHNGSLLALREESNMANQFIDAALVERLERLRAGDRSSSEAGEAGRAGADTVNSRAQTLLDALQAKQRDVSIETVVKTALTDFLQSEALRDHMASATSATVKKVIQDCFSSDVTSAYLPMLERSHRQLMRQVSRTLDEAFREMEAEAGPISRSSQKTMRSIRSALERHQQLLEASAERPAAFRRLKGTIHNILEKEIAEWRGHMIDVVSTTAGPWVAPPPPPAPEPPARPAGIPCSPPQPAEPGRSAIEQLMSAAEINISMQHDPSGTFERALLAADLSLVMAACRAAPAHVFAPRCRLQQHVLLALAQQLAADLVVDTQLKCRFLEDTLLNLDAGDPVTRTHLPRVLGEVCGNLSRFLQVYPSHMCSRQIRMLAMAAGGMLKRQENA